MTHALPKSNNKARREAIGQFALRLGQLAPGFTMSELSAVMLAARMMRKAPHEAKEILPRVIEATKHHGFDAIFDGETLTLWHVATHDGLAVPLY